MPEAPITTTYQGHAASTQDALVIIEACLRGELNHISRRPRHSELRALPRSGDIFVYEFQSSGITQWQDGVAWSPPVRVGNFELRRQLATPADSNRANGR